MAGQPPAIPTANRFVPTVNMSGDIWKKQSAENTLHDYTIHMRVPVALLSFLLLFLLLWKKNNRKWRTTKIHAVQLQQKRRKHAHIRKRVMLYQPVGCVEMPPVRLLARLFVPRRVRLRRSHAIHQLATRWLLRELGPCHRRFGGNRLCHALDRRVAALQLLLYAFR